MVFVDYDGTITDLDTSDVLVRASVGPKRWGDLDAALYSGSMTLREVLAKQFSYVQLSLDDAAALLDRDTAVDPGFAPFVTACEARGIPVTVLSSGIAPLIERRLASIGLAHLPVLANTIEMRPDGSWRMHFRDESANGHDKAAAVRAAREHGATAVFVGDGYSDFDAALVADHRFAKRNRALEAFLRKRGIAFTPFDTFEEISFALFDYKSV